MRALTIQAETLAVASGLYSALFAFDPELAGDEDDGYRVTVELGSDDRRIVDVLDGIQAYVTARDNGSAPVDVEGHRYTFHARER